MTPRLLSTESAPGAAPRLRDVPGAGSSAAFIALFFCLGVFINSFTNLPLNFLLKERLRLNPLQLSWFLLISDSAWYVKPAFGLLTDRVPLWGSRRRSYLLLMGGVLTTAWAGLALAPGYRYGPLVGTMAVSALALAFMNTVTAGLLAELSRASGMSGRLNSLRQFAAQAALLVAGPLGGKAAQLWPFPWVAGTAAGVAAVLTAGAMLLIRERSSLMAFDATVSPQALPRDAKFPRLIEVLRSRGIWLALGFILLVELAPGFNTPLLFYQTDTLHFAKEWLGWAQMCAAGGAILGTLGYAVVCRRQAMRFVLPAVLVTHAVATLAWLALRTPESVLLIRALTGMTGALASLVIFDLATRAAPRGVEGTVLALLFAGVNIALKASDLIGSKLYALHWSLQGLVLLNAGTTLLAVFFVPLLPRALVARRDGEAPRDDQK